MPQKIMYMDICVYSYFKTAIDLSGMELFVMAYKRRDYE